MQIEGNIDLFSLSEILAMMIGSSVTGVLEVGEGDHAGRIFCCGGQVYHAELGNQTGLDAIRLMLQASAARFRFVSGIRHDRETLWPTPQVLVGFTRRYERLHRQLRRHIPDLGYIPSLRESGDGASIRLSATIWPVLALVDGQRSIAEIAERLGHEPIEIGLMLGDLVARGLAAVQAPRAPNTPASGALATTGTDQETALPSGHTAADEGSTSAGFFEWLLTGRSKEQPAAWFSPARALRRTAAS